MCSVMYTNCNLQSHGIRIQEIKKMEGAIFQVYIQRIITKLECLLVCQLVATYEKNKTDSVHFQNLSIQNVDFSFLNKLGMAVYKVQR